MHKSAKILIIALIIFSIIIALFLFNKKELTPVPFNEGVVAPIKKPVDTLSWNEYHNNQLGFSIKLPQEVFAIGYCHPEQSTLIPMRVLEDNANGIVYVFQDYYNLDKDGKCVKIISSLDDLKNQASETAKENTFSGYNFGWTIIVNNIKNDEEVSKYVKANFGSTCSITDKTLQKDGNYQISIKGRDLIENGEVTMDTTCLTNFVYKILYSQEKQKLMSVVLGQECKFNSSNPEDPSSSYQCYDDAMVQSFKFE